jgi:hypothetical protein
MGRVVTGLGVEHEKERTSRVTDTRKSKLGGSMTMLSGRHVRVGRSDSHCADLSTGTRRDRSSGLVHPAGQRTKLFPEALRKVRDPAEADSIGDL